MPGSVTLYQLHRIIQAVMGWTDTHLHEFQRGQVSYGESDPEFGVRRVSERRTRLRDVLQTPGDRMRYRYDFGDDWEHDLVLEAVAPNSAGKVQPQVLQGRRACPPEDVGGIYGYYEFLEAMGNPEHPSHQEMVDWWGGPFDAAALDLDDVNQALSRMRLSRP